METELASGRSAAVVLVTQDPALAKTCRPHCHHAFGSARIRPVAKAISGKSRSTNAWLLRRTMPQALTRVVLEAFIIAMFAATLWFADDAVQLMTPNTVESLDADIADINSRLAAAPNVASAEPLAAAEALLGSHEDPINAKMLFLLLGIPGVLVVLTVYPKVLPADEPTGEPDEATASGTTDLFEKSLASEGMAIMTVSHNSKVTERASRSLIMRDGVLVDGN